jgi:glycosyltransferase involved in cell wall biosynthesis
VIDSPPPRPPRDRAAQVERLPLTVVLPVLNEAVNLGAALDSVGFAADQLVVDSGSTDATVEIARTHGARLLAFEYDGGPEKKKSWTLSTQRFPHEWVLFLDADERVTPELRAEIERIVSADDPSLSGAYVDRELVFMGRRMRSFAPNWNMRLFRPERASLEDLGLGQLPDTGDNEIHEHFVVSGRTTYLEPPLKHEDYRGIAPWVDRHNKYATWEAHLYRRLSLEPLASELVRLPVADAFKRKRILRRLWVRLPARPFLRFVVWYVFRRGFADGVAGFYFCLLMAWYELLIGLKLRELDG